ncbi:GNAT family N-acetyltransferase [Natronosalvus caseinilyticus]|uniref:GNAT family N-acetyltransferase n=1 Tax=Natronosalvus caseinilyticus TaxID=2953747 RepID=UPI0028AB7A7B|nr:GNAT family protein [Natronosalvus caseinilyticus]
MTTLFPETIETDRLRLELADPESVDIEELYGVYSGDALESAFRYVLITPFETAYDPLSFLESARENHQDGSSAIYIIRPRESEDGADELAGTTTLFVDWDCRRAELAIALVPRFWGRGYSGERAEALLEVAFERLDLEVVVVSCHPDNEQSRRAIERYVDRFGGQYDGRIRNARVLDDEPIDLRRYTIDREQYAGAGVAA